MLTEVDEGEWKELLWRARIGYTNKFSAVIPCTVYWAVRHNNLNCLQ